MSGTKLSVSDNYTFTPWHNTDIDNIEAASYKGLMFINNIVKTIINILTILPNCVRCFSESIAGFAVLKFSV